MNNFEKNNPELFKSLERDKEIQEKFEKAESLLNNPRMSSQDLGLACSILLDLKMTLKEEETRLTSRLNRLYKKFKQKNSYLFKKINKQEED